MCVKTFYRSLFHLCTIYKGTLSCRRMFRGGYLPTREWHLTCRAIAPVKTAIYCAITVRAFKRRINTRDHRRSSITYTITLRKQALVWQPPAEIPSAGLMWGQRLRRWPHIEPALGISTGWEVVFWWGTFHHRCMAWLLPARAARRTPVLSTVKHRADRCPWNIK